MALELAWSCSGSASGEMVNVVNPYTDTVHGPAWNLWWFKERLIEVGWSVISSSNGATAAASDLWGSTFNSTTDVDGKNLKIKYGTTGARSWIALAAPTGSTAAGYKIILDYGNTSNIGYRMQIIATSGSISTGTTSARPTGSYDFGIYYNNALTANDICIHDSTTNAGAQHRVSFHYVPNNGAFYFTEAQVNKAQFTFFAGFFPLQNTHAVDQFKWVIAGVDNHSATTFTPTGGRALYNEGSSAITGRSHDGGSFLSLGGVIPAVSPDGAGGALAALFHTNYLSAPNSSDATYSDFPIFVVNTALGPIELKGRLPDISWCSVSIPNGAMTPPKSVASDKYERTKYLYFWLPWVSTNAPIF